jgi:hypothetical protein
MNGLCSRFGVACLAAPLLTVTGCSFLRVPSSPPKAQVESLQLTNRATGPVTFMVLQAQVMRFADTLDDRIFLKEGSNFG